MKTRKSPSGILFACFSFILLALVVAALAWFILSLPQFAQQKYGAPAPHLDFTQKIYLSARLLLQSDDLTAPAAATNDPQLFQIQLGETTYDISQRLESEGIIRSARAFRDYLVYSGLDTSIQSGEYTLNPRMNTLETAHALQDATPQQVTFHILAGWRLEEIAANLPTSGLSISPLAFLAETRTPLISHPILDRLPTGASLEGFLYPDSYQLDRQATLDEFLTTILDNFRIRISPALEDAYRDQGLDLYQAVILASIVQRESVLDEEMPTIASVFLNRLAQGMKLETDPTVQYALGYQEQMSTWWKNPLGLDDLRFDSPYNTYIYPGLPPGPIANPGLLALMAVAKPAQTDYLYFRAACDGSGRHAFSLTFEEHQSFACP